jgi:O-antigen ligase
VTSSFVSASAWRCAAGRLKIELSAQHSLLKGAARLVADQPSPCVAPALVAALCLATGLPVLLAFNQPPSPTALNQGAAVGGWGFALVMASLATRRSSPHQMLHDVWAPVAALTLITAAAGLSGLLGHLPAALSLSVLGLLLVTVGVLLTGAAAPSLATLRTGFFAALAAVGLCSLLIGLLQVLAPDAIDSQWIARSGIPGRAVGNLRQPNHLSTLLLWSAVAVVPLLEAPAIRRHAAAAVALIVLFGAMLLGVVLSGSRTGLLGVAVLAAWGLLDRRLSRTSRALLIASPLICIACWMLLGWLSSRLDIGALGASTRLGQSQDYSSGRWSIWRDTLALIAQNPWLGVGFGEFNFAWTLTPSADREPQFFDHTHNLPLHLAVELGVPLALLVLGFLLWGLWQAWHRSRRIDGSDGAARRGALVMVLLMALHSQLEYPLWYAYFLLPTAFAWGLCLRAPDPEPTPTSSAPSRWMLAGGAAMILAAAVTVWDYQRVVAIFAPPADDPSSLAERIVEGRHSLFFAHHADYALVTTLEGAGTLPGVFDRAPHFLLDTRLMIAWAQGLAARGEVDKARHVAARLREFRNAGAKGFFAPCDDAAVTDKPFQCSPPERAYSWRDFR